MSCFRDWSISRMKPCRQDNDKAQRDRRWQRPHNVSCSYPQEAVHLRRQLESSTRTLQASRSRLPVRHRNGQPGNSRSRRLRVRRRRFGEHDEIGLAREIESFDRDNSQYEQQSSDLISDAIKHGIVCGGMAHEGLKQRIDLSISRLSTYKALRDEIINYSRARRTWTDPNAMQVDAVHVNGSASRWQWFTTGQRQEWQRREGQFQGGRQGQGERCESGQ